MRPVIMSTQYTQHESLNHKAWVLTRPTDMGTITDQTMVNRGHMYTITNQGEWEPGVRKKQFSDAKRPVTYTSGAGARNEQQYRGKP
jgi:hypothetical protein